MDGGRGGGGVYTHGSRFGMALEGINLSIIHVEISTLAIRIEYRGKKGRIQDGPSLGLHTSASGLVVHGPSSHNPCSHDIQLGGDGITLLECTIIASRPV